MEDLKTNVLFENRASSPSILRVSEKKIRFNKFLSEFTVLIYRIITLICAIFLFFSLKANLFKIVLFFFNCTLPRKRFPTIIFLLIVSF